MDAKKEENKTSRQALFLLSETVRKVRIVPTIALTQAGEERLFCLFSGVLLLRQNGPTESFYWGSRTLATIGGAENIIFRFSATWGNWGAYIQSYRRADHEVGEGFKWLITNLNAGTVRGGMSTPPACSN